MILKVLRKENGGIIHLINSGACYLDANGGAKDENGKEYACAIDLSGTEFAEVSNLSQDTPLLGLVAGSQRTDHSVALIRYIFDPSVTK